MIIYDEDDLPRKDLTHCAKCPKGVEVITHWDHEKVGNLVKVVSEGNVIGTKFIKSRPASYMFDEEIAAVKAILREAKLT